MIDAVRGRNYPMYNGVDNRAKSEERQEVQSLVQFNVQDILSHIDHYTYTEEDMSAVEDKLVQQIKEKFNILEEDVYELYKRGVNLEQLDEQEIEHVKNVKTHSLLEDEEDEGADEKASLEDKISLIKEENDNMYLAALSDPSSITINSLYESNFKGNYKKSDADYSQQDVKDVLKLNDIAANSSSMWAADLLMMYGMGVNATSVNKLMNMQSAVGALNIQETGNVSGDAELASEQGVNYQPEYIDRITDDLGMVTDEHIQKLIEEGKDINIDELRKSIHKNAEEVLKDKGVQNGAGENAQAQGEGLLDSGEESAKGDVLEQVEDIKRQILQIATKLTVEAAQKLSGKMPLESSSLAEVAEGLQQMEADMAVQALHMAQVPVTEENIQVVSDTMSVARQISSHFTAAVQLEMETGETANLNEIQAALTKYDENETPVEQRFGETMAKVENQIEGLLERQGIEVTKENIQAAKALIVNQVEVSQENIQNIQDIVLKLNVFLEEMTPLQAAQMIKEGINPYHATINQLLSVIGDNKAEGIKATVAEAIVAMEKNGQISEEQKEGMIGLYRILQAVINNKEAVMGYLFKNELPMTVENLQIAAKYAKGRKGLQVTVDDHFGEQESISYNNKTARQMLSDSSQSGSKMAEVIKTLEEMELPINEENVSKMSKISAILYPYIKEQFKKEMGRFDGFGSLPDSFMEKLDVVQNTDASVIDQMIKNEMPLTLNNIYWMEKIMENPGLYGELLDENGMLKQELPSDLEEMEEELQQLEQLAKSSKEEAMLTHDLEKYKSYKQLEEAVAVQRQRIDKEGLYQIPFVIAGERKMVNLYVYQDKENDSQVQDESHLKAMISYHTKNLGDVKAYVEIKGDQIGFRMEAESSQASEVLGEHKQQLIEGLKKIGYNTQYSEYSDYSEAVDEKEQAAFRVIHKDSKFEVMI